MCIRDSIKVTVPTPEFDERMSLFLGVGHDETDAPIDWDETNQEPSSSFENQLTFAPKPLSPFKTNVEWEEEMKFKENMPIAPERFTARAPELPVKEEIRYNPPFFQRIFMSKQRKIAKIETIYQQKLKSYHKKKARYDRKLVVHKDAVNVYKKELAIASANKEKARLAFYESPEAKKMQAKFDEQYQQDSLNYKEKLAKWEAYRAKRIADFEASFEQQGNVTRSDMSRYIFTVNTLGWVNIDVFYKSELPKGKLQLANVTDKDLFAFVLFKSINSIVRLRPNGEGVYIASGLPIGEKVEVLAIRVKNGKALMANLETEVSEEQVLDLQFEPARLKDIKGYMAGIN